MREEAIIALFLEDAIHLSDTAHLEHRGPVTTDSMVEGNHFDLQYFPADALAHKLLHVNLSDLAASGARADWCFLNLGIPDSITDDFLRSFAAAFRHLCQEQEVRLLGGDTFRAPALFLSLTMGGTAERTLERRGGQPGDTLYLTGHTGLSQVGLELLLSAQRPDAELPIKSWAHLPVEQLARWKDQAIERHLRPIARCEWGQWLARQPQVHAAMDVSDGLLADGQRLARASGLQIILEVADLPDPYRLGPDLLVTSGEELELLFLAQADLSCPFPVQAIGKARAADRSGPPGEAGLILQSQGQPFHADRPAFDHFH